MQKRYRDNVEEMVDAHEDVIQDIIADLEETKNKLDAAIRRIEKLELEQS